MRKGQEKILENARNNGYNECSIKILSMEGMTLKHLNRLYHLLYFCKNKDDEWIYVFTSIDDFELMELILRYDSKDGIDISVEELEQISTREKICKYFSKNGVMCNDLFETKLWWQ